MTLKEIALDAVWGEVKKAMFCNLETGDLVYIKNLPEEEEAGCTHAKNLDEYVRNVVAGKLIHEMDVEGYQKHISLECFRSEEIAKRGGTVFSCRQKIGGSYQWFTYETKIPDRQPGDYPCVLILGKCADSDTCAMIDAMNQLSGIYRKIARIDLLEDTYEIIKTCEDNQNPDYDTASSCSEWFRSFALRGSVHEKDLEAYLLFTELGAMRKRFQKSREGQVLHYRRFTHNEFRWVSMELIPSVRYTNEHQEVMVFIRDLEELNK